MKQRILLVVITLVILLGLGYYSYTVYKSPGKEPPQTVLPEEKPQPEVVWASGDNSACEASGFKLSHRR